MAHWITKNRFPTSSASVLLWYNLLAKAHSSNYLLGFLFKEESRKAFIKVLIHVATTFMDCGKIVGKYDEQSLIASYVCIWIENHCLSCPIYATKFLTKSVYIISYFCANFHVAFFPVYHLFCEEKYQGPRHITWNYCLGFKLHCL